MADYWKKKLDELNQSTAKKTTKKPTGVSKETYKPSKSSSSSSYWKDRMDELEESKDIAPIAVTKKLSNNRTLGTFGGVEKDVAKTILGDEDVGFLGKIKQSIADDLSGKNTRDKIKEAEESGESSFWDWLGSHAVEGLASFNKSITATADLIIGKPLEELGWEDNPVSSLADYYSDRYDEHKKMADVVDANLGGSKLATYSGDFVSGTVAAVPNAIAALMSAGTSAAGTTAGLASTAAYETGNILTKAGLKVAAMAKNPQYWLSFAQTAGTGYEEAKAKGASDIEAAFGATISSLVKAGIEIGTGGGSGIQGLPDEVAKGEGSKILAWVKSSLEEGAEENVQGVVDRIVSNVLYGSDEKILDGKVMAEEFAMGAAIGGALGGGQIGVQSVANAVGSAVEDAQKRKLTENEQAVVDKVYKDELAEREQDGKKLTAREKSKLYDSVLEQMDKGRISTNTIEEVLGGETYKTYKDTITNEDSLREEFTSLNQMKQGEMTGEQIDRRAELKAKLEELKNTSQRERLKVQLGEEVFGLVQNDRLAESYNERARKSQTFEADLTQYDAKQRDTIQRAIDSGILNNTNRTHEFVDMIAKITADKGVLFDFTNNAKLKESGFAVDGKSVNGFVTKDGVTLNIDSAKSLHSVTGHEITHVLEGTELYTELQSVLFEYAKSKGEYDSRYASLSKLYEGIEGADVDAELTADLVGDYLFTDTDFIRNLSTEHRNVFQKIYDEIKYLCKVATAGSKEARELEKVKKAFEDAYRADSKAQTDDAKYSLSAETDKAYLDAVNRGDMELAQKMVDDVAIGSGYNYRGVHRAKTEFTVFDKNKIGSGAGLQFGDGFYVSLEIRDSATADYADSAYGKVKMDLYVKMQSPLELGKPISDETVAKMQNDLAWFGDDESVRYGVSPETVKERLTSGDSYEQMEAIRWLTQQNGMQVSELLKKYGFDGIISDSQYVKQAVVFDENQLKSADPVTYDGNGNVVPLSDRFNTENNDIRYSLSRKGETTKRGFNDTYGKDIALAPVGETVAEKATVEFPDDLSPMSEDDSERFGSLTDADAPPEVEAPYYESKPATADDPFEDRDIYEVGNRKVKAYMYENPEVKPFFQEEARGLLQDLNNSVKGERWYNDRVYYETGGEAGWGGTTRHTSDDIAYLLDEHHYTYEQIEKGINAIIEDNGAENNAVSKRIEFILNDRLMNGYTDFFYGEQVPPNQDYINLVNEKQITEYSNEAFDALMANADDYAPPVGDVAPVSEAVTKVAEPVTEQVTDEAPIDEEQIAKIRRADPKAKEGSWWNRTKKKFNEAVSLLGDKGWVFENLSKKTGNRNLEAKYDFMKNRSKGVAQEYINDHLLPIYEKVKATGKAEEFDYYARHLLNIDRMSLETEAERVRRNEIRKQLEGYTERQIQSIASEMITRNTPKDRVEQIYLAQEYLDLGGAKGKNKPVYGASVTAEISRNKVAEIEAQNPEFKEYEQEILEYNKALRQYAVSHGLITQSVANKWAKMYPHYVPIRRTDRAGASVSVPLDSNRTGVNNPFKRAEGGNSDFEPLFETMAQNTEQIFRAVSRNEFGKELMTTLEAETRNDSQDVDATDILETVDENDNAVLQAGQNGQNPQFTVFVKGKRVTFDITEEMFKAMQPAEGILGDTYKIPNAIASGYKKILTEYDPFFSLFRNPIKDSKDVLFNSRHALATYMTAPRTFKEIASKGEYYTEYVKNGGKTTSYYDSKTHTFTEKDGTAKKVVGFPWRMYKAAAETTEMFWRLSEYIASREAGESVEVAMLDAARVTTNFGAGGDLTKWANRNGALFLNPSVQGAMQIGRNVREAYHDGLKGSAVLAAKVLATGLGGMFFNWLLWHDDEEYEELSDYVKQNYFVVWKTEDGKFVRIPKGRMEAVIQNGFEQMENLITGDDEVDMKTFAELVVNNLAPNNPLENNLISPIKQAVTNTTWYKEDLVPARLQNNPVAEQYDETTDSVSKWIGEKLDISPYKINYVMQQYGGGFADVALPMLTNEAEGSNLFAPIADQFITDSKQKNQNVSDFYTKKDELAVNANSMYATEEDALMAKYMNSINSELSELYAKKREIQNSDLSDSEKYGQVRDIQNQIVDLTRESLNSYDDIDYQTARDGEYCQIGDRYFKKDDEGEWQKLSDKEVTKYLVTSAAGDAPYASDGKNHYRWYEPGEDAENAKEGWRKLTDDELKRQNKVTSGLGITPEQYWSNKDEYGYAYDHPDNYAVSKAVGGYDAYKGYSSDLYDIKADKDSNGKSISGSRKRKVAEYINGLDIDYGEKLILFKSEYNADDSYNYEICEYMNSRNDLSYEEKLTILREIGFEVDSYGNVSW